MTDRQRRARDAEKSRRWRAANPERARSQKLTWKRQNPEKVKAYNLKAHRKCLYGMEPAEFEALHRRQRGRCAICRVDFKTLTSKQLHIDHDHKTKKVRGLLCGRCNVAVGMLNDDPKRATLLAQYLRKKG